MDHSLELKNTHFRQMKKHLASVEKFWGEGALATVKEELDELKSMIREIENTIKNQLYYSLKGKEVMKLVEKNKDCKD